ncbi:Hypothetical protein NTJ_06657 [Nesidiocoris tenuis]|uniref:Uncharacterized protein n=1 Tax=Nesidiocoris tenuis TaxID=355587 RepID=A0ABN7APF1_9HEMI|nr:Hypothetical protein NTJ_06657 [Nesidiocoris tenuis]
MRRSASANFLPAESQWKPIHSIRRISSRSRTVDFGFSITTSRFPRFIEAKERTDIPRKLRRGRACGSTSTRPVVHHAPKLTGCDTD